MKLAALTKRQRATYEKHSREMSHSLRRIARKGAPGDPPPVARKRVSRDAVQKKTDGNCHMCGDDLFGSWQIGHVKPYRRGGECTVENCLPICSECNRLRWNYKPEVLRFMLLFGRYAKQAIRGQHGKPTDLGKQLIELHIRNTWSNKRRSTRARRQ